AYFAICPCRSNHYCVGRGRVSHPFWVSQDPVRTGGFVTLLRQPARYPASSNRRMGAKRSKQARCRLRDAPWRIEVSDSLLPLAGKRLRMLKLADFPACHFDVGFHDSAGWPAGRPSNKAGLWRTQDRSESELCSLIHV